MGANGEIRIVRDTDLQEKADREYFKGAIALSVGEVYVSDVDLNKERGSIETPHVPTLRLATPIQGPDAKPFGIVVINLDLRPIFDEIRSTAGPDRQIYVVNERGDYLFHPDASREFGFELGAPNRWQADLPGFAAVLHGSEFGTELTSDTLGEPKGAAIASARLASGPRVAVLETVPAATILAPAASIQRSSVIVGLAAVIGASLLAAGLARSFSKPLVQMTRAIEGFPAVGPVEAPIHRKDEIGVLARAFVRAAGEVRQKTGALEEEVTRHRDTEAALLRHADRERLFSAAVESSEDTIVTKTLDGVITGWNPAAERLFGFSASEVIGRSIDIIVPDDRRTEVRDILRKIRQGEKIQHYETVRVNKDRKRIEVSLSVSPVKSPSGAIIGACKIARDVSEKKLAEQVLNQEVAERRRIADVLDNTITSMVDAVLVADERGRILLSNPAADRLMVPAVGLAPEDWSQVLDTFMLDGTTDLPFEQRPLTRAIRGEVVQNYELIVRRGSDGRVFSLIANGGPIRDNAQQLKGAVMVYRDITEAKETDRQLRQAQKMEAVGQLTGGIAHDFNNILTVITGTIEILAEAVAKQPQLAAITKMIDEAAARGAELTQRLLAFARRQPLQPAETDVNALIVDAAKLLRPTLGEQVEIQSMLEEPAWRGLVDPGQLTTAIVNLALNARDAMPSGGKLTLETANVYLDESYAAAHREVRAGPYVMIAVSDTGAGIPAAIQDKVFEPFFTTKEVGKGTGLGLSMVYGFVKQSGGHIKIYSEEGQGTTIKVYLPRAEGDSGRSADAPSVVPLTGGKETILVVEDDMLVRQYVIAQLESLGYTTVAASNSLEALALIASSRKFDLLFTDVIMPGAMNGRQLADTAIKRLPELKVLFTSGYAENAIIHHGRLDAGVLLLAKPYRKSDLARMIRTALGATNNGVSAND